MKKLKPRIASGLCFAVLAAVQLACGQSGASSEPQAAVAETEVSPSEPVEPVLPLVGPWPLPVESLRPAVLPASTEQAPTASEEASPASTVSEPLALHEPVPGDTLRKLDSAGQERSYLLHIPPGIDPEKPTALVLVYHGIGLDAAEMVRITGLSDLADKAGFVAVYPNGTGVWRSWNGGVCCGEAAQQNVDDVAFTRQIIQDLQGDLNLDPRRIYAAGFSNGAIMAYRLACDLSDQIAAIAPVSAAPAVRSCQPARPVPVIHFHGEADELNPYEGGITSSGLNFLSVESGIAAWVKLNGCPAEAAENVSGDVVHRVYAPCKEGAAVELYKILGGNHAWPGGEPVSLLPRFTVPTAPIEASKLIWEFFSSHPIP